MSFLFEIQSKKNKIQIPEKKHVSMDVRAPKSIPVSSSRPSLLGSITYSYSPAILDNITKRLDGVRTTNTYASEAKLQYAKRVSEIQYHQVTKRIPSRSRVALVAGNLWEALRDGVSQIHIVLPGFTPNKLVYGSIMSGVAFGMVSLGLIEKTFESNVSAAPSEQTVETVNLETENYKPEKDVFMQYFSDAADAEYQENVRSLVKGYPIEEMLPYIFEKDRVTAAFLIGIAKKESNWGKRKPVLEGQDCFNYWGYRGQRRLMGSGGHTCFNSREDAIDTVAKRLDTLISSERLNTPAKLIVWKCGMSCEGHSRESVEKWIADVDAYYGEMMALESENTEIEEPTDGS